MQHYTETERQLRQMVAESIKQIEDTWLHYEPNVYSVPIELSFNGEKKLWRIEVYKAGTFRACAPMLHQATHDICHQIVCHFDNIRQANFMLLECSTRGEPDYTYEEPKDVTYKEGEE